MRVAFFPGSKSRLTDYDLGRFGGDSLFDRLARAVCHAGCLPRKELYEAWEMARRIRRRLRGGRVVDMGAGHGLLAHVLMILDDSSPEAVMADTARPPSAEALHEVLAAEWPRLRGRLTPVSTPLQTYPVAADDLVVSSHACGGLTDVIIDRAASARARIGVLPCCHDVAANATGPLAGWLDAALAIDVMRAVQLQDRGYRVWTQTIPPAITPKNRLLLGIPSES